MAVFENIKGTLETFFRIGRSGPGAKNNSNVLEIRNNADSAFAVLRAANVQASGTTLNDVATLLDIKGRCPNITFSFDGASAPAAGTNNGKFGFCHTAGGAYSAGDVVYDDGSNLLTIPSDIVRLITTSSAI